jgi:cyclopropane fatty-acyl-phospholipid synthase-like methyltransferase
MKENYRSFIGKQDKYDLIGAQQFNLLFFLGLRENDVLLDIGCGSLSAGRLFIPYLLPGKYYGIEPEEWLIKEALRKELGKEIVKIKKPVFKFDSDFKFSSFNQKFDYILAHSIFTHASQNQIKLCLNQTKKVMKPTSLFIATFAKGKKNYFGEKWVYPGFVTYTYELLKKIFMEIGLVCKTINWPHPDYQTWLIAKLKNNDGHSQKNSIFNEIENKTLNFNILLGKTRENLMDLYLES